MKKKITFRQIAAACGVVLLLGMYVVSLLLAIFSDQLGESIHSGDREFGVPKEYPLNAAGWRIDEEGNHYIRVKGVRWFTNLEHGRRHQPLQLMTMADNIKFSRHKDLRGKEYQKYDNYDAIEVPFTDAIPSDYAFWGRRLCSGGKEGI